MPSQLLSSLNDRVLVFDGAMGTSIHAWDLDIDKDYLGCENCTDILVSTRPDVVQAIHESFLEAGADAVETDSFGSNPLVLEDFNLSDQAFDLNKAAAQIARAACETYATADHPRFVIGSMGPGTKLITLNNTTWDAMLASYRVQASGLIAGGADALLIETCQDLLQVKCAINACLAALEDAGKDPQTIPIMVSITIEQTGTMLLGTSVSAAICALSSYPIASLGLNCATGPAEMHDHLRLLSTHWDRALSVLPNAGLPSLVQGQTVYPLGPEAFAEQVAQFVKDFSINIVGGCCGTTPEHIRNLATKIHEHTPTQRNFAPISASCSSLYTPTEYRQDASFLIVGERCNASGSRKFKRLLEAEDIDGIVSLAREQVREHSHVLDINVDYAGRDNAADMNTVVHHLVRQVDVPLMLDSTQIRTIEAGLKTAAGKCIINSANFEDGNEKFDELCSLAMKYGAALVIGSIDEDENDAMARTHDRKVQIAQRAFKRATEHHGLSPADLFFDLLVLPISTGMEADRRSASELIKAVKTLATELPTSQIICGLSNISFGLSPASRVILNTVFLSELVAAGLTSAIVHSSKILPRNRIADEHWNAALDLIHDRRHESSGGTGLPQGITDPSYDPLNAFIELFKDVASADTSSQRSADLPLEQKLQAHIIDGEKQGLQETIDHALEKYPPLEIINDHLLAGMKIVGELFGSGQMQLPFVLQSAEVMKQAVALLEPLMEKSQSKTQGSIVLATVKGDVHDIGKNLVDIILSNNGYTVHNIGIKQPIADIINAWKQTNAQAIGLSGLLVKSVTVMEDNLRELNNQNINVPVMLGGAALSRHYCEDHLRSIYNGQCYYGKDAFEGLRLMKHITSGQTDVIHDEITQRLAKRKNAQQVIDNAKSKKDATSTPTTATLTNQSTIAPVSGVPTPPFWGSRVVQDIDLASIYPFINEVALFRGQWQFRKGAMSDEQYQEQLQSTVRPLFDQLKQRCIKEHILTPSVVYGYFPCQSDGNDLIVYDPDQQNLEVQRFSFPRQSKGKNLCISDFFHSVQSGTMDVLALHCVTVGQKVSQIAKTLFESDQYADYLYMHGIGVECAEALAEFWHKHIRTELNIADDDHSEIRKLFTQNYQGSRYSFGYPACPNMADQEKLFALLEPQRIGCNLTENWQIDPEQSTSAIIVHHPQAKYFSI